MDKEMTMTKQITTLGRRAHRVAVLLALATGILAILGSFGATAAMAAPAAAPAWQLTSTAEPTNLIPGSNYSTNLPTATQAGLAGAGPQYQINAVNVGGASSGGSITVTDTLPDGVVLDSAGATATANKGFYWINLGTPFSCTSNAQTVTCTDTSTAVTPGEEILVVIPVDVSATASGTVTNTATISGGGVITPVSTQEQSQVSTTPASYGISRFSSTALNADGTVDSQAGSSPYEDVTSFGLNTVLDSAGAPEPAGSVKDLTVALPPGFVGYPDSMPACRLADLDDDSACPPDTQVGQIEIQLAPTAGGGLMLDLPVYNMQTAGNEPARFGTYLVEVPMIMNTSVRSGGDYGIDVTVPNISTVEPFLNATMILWGDPNDAHHNAQRVISGGCKYLQGACEYGQSTAGGPVAFLANGTSCAQPQTATLTSDSWQDPGTNPSATSSSPALTGCDAVPFGPRLTAKPTTSTADSPSGLSVDVSVPQVSPVSGDATSTLKDATVTLPQGVTVDPSAASGLTGCAPDQIGMDNGNAPSCPDSSKVGSVTLDTPLLSDALTGGIYVAQQDNNPFNSLLAIYVTAYADGVWVKLAGKVTADPVTGQLQATFSNNPQLPFSDLKLDFFGGSQGILATPQACGTYTTRSDLSPWSGGSDATPSDSFDISSGCVSGFAPTFTAGTQNAQAGAYSPLVLSLQRSDTDQNFQGLSVRLPKGLLAKLAGVDECSDAQLAQAAASTGAQEQASPSCPVNSQVGTVTAGSGVGNDPFFLHGTAYLTGPYKGAPYGLAIVVPAVAGPYDLGTVVVRQALFIDPNTTQVTDVSDPFPTILQGIPLDIRRIDVALNRSGFTVNPTSCDATSVTGTATSVSGLSTGLSDRFQVGGCQALGYAPKLKVALTGNGKTSSGDHPALTADYTVPAGDANTSNVRVALPLSLALDPNNSEVVCPWANVKDIQSGAPNCPANTKVGTATVTTPLLSQPLSGPVYLVQGLKTNSNGTVTHTLPKLLVTLRGQLALNLWAQTSVNGANMLVSTFSGIPDAAVSRFDLTINGGPKGILVVTGRGKSVCTQKEVANGTFTAQSGKQTPTEQITLTTPCGKPTTGKVQVTKKTVKGSKLTISVKVPAKGKFTVTGTDVKSTSRTASKGSTYKVSTKLTNKAKAQLRRKHRLQVTVKVAYTPGSGIPSTTTIKATLKA